MGRGVVAGARKPKPAGSSARGKGAPGRSTTSAGAKRSAVTAKNGHPRSSRKSKMGSPPAKKPAHAARKKATSSRSKSPPARRSAGNTRTKANAPARRPAARRATSKAASAAPRSGIGSPVTAGPGERSISGQVYQRGKLLPLILHLDAGGNVVRSSKSQRLAEHVDYGKRAILPGAIDIHVHFREPGHTQKEDITTGSTAAAFGGVTGYVDMPNTNPPTITLQRLDEKLQLMAEKSIVDYGAWAGGTWYTGELEGMLKHAVGVKTYLGSSTGDLLLDDMERFRNILEAAGKAGRPVALHAEAERILQHHRRTENTVHDHDQTRPPHAEVEAIYDAMRHAKEMRKPPTIHIAHAASPDAVQASLAATFSTGVCPHHLLLDTDVGLGHAYGKMNPPLRSPDVRKELWRLFAAGKIPILESDHAPHTKADKEDNFHAAPSGVPGVETMVPLMLAQAKAGKVALATVVDAVTKHPAALLGLTGRGTLETGSRADFMVVDLKKSIKVDNGALHSKCGWSPYEGMPAIFPSDVHLAGQPVIADGQLVGKPGMGKPLLR